ETEVDGIRLESKDTLAKAEGRTVSDVLGAGGLSLAAYILRALGIETGLKVVTHSRVPAGSGLGGSSALAVAVVAAAARAVGRELDADRMWPVVRDAEAQNMGVPAGMQDHLAAIHGGVLGVSSREIDRIAAAAQSAGGAAKVCGAGGGGMVAVWAPPGRREGVESAVTSAGFKSVSFRVDLRGLEVE